MSSSDTVAPTLLLPPGLCWCLVCEKNAQNLGLLPWETVIRIISKQDKHVIIHFHVFSRQQVFGGTWRPVGCRLVNIVQQDIEPATEGDFKRVVTGWSRVVGVWCRNLQCRRVRLLCTELCFGSRLMLDCSEWRAGHLQSCLEYQELRRYRRLHNKRCESILACFLFCIKHMHKKDTTWHLYQNEYTSPSHTSINWWRSSHCSKTVAQNDQFAQQYI